MLWKSPRGKQASEHSPPTVLRRFHGSHLIFCFLLICFLFLLSRFIPVNTNRHLLCSYVSILTFNLLWYFTYYAPSSFRSSNLFFLHLNFYFFDYFLRKKWSAPTLSECEDCLPESVRYAQVLSEIPLFGILRKGRSDGGWECHCIFCEGHHGQDWREEIEAQVWPERISVSKQWQPSALQTRNGAKLPGLCSLLCQRFTTFAARPQQH